MVDKPEKTRPRLFLIDGYALIYRAFFAMIARPLISSKGENTSAAFGFTRFLLKIVEEHEPDYLGVVLDAGTSQREELYPEYKATRQKMPDELAASLPRIQAVVDAFRVPIIRLEDHEADDVIGTLSRQAVEAGLEAVIVSGDKDFYQLIRDGVCLLNPGRGGSAGVEEEWVDVRNASERLGVPPERVVDYLALIGDSSDNIPGAKGIGPKTAIQLIEQFGPVEQILAHVEEISGKRARTALEEHAADVALSKRLVTILTDLPIELDLEALALAEPDHARLRELFIDLEFHSLVREYAAPESSTAALETDYRVAATPADVEEVVRSARAAERVAVSVEGTSPEVVGLALAVEPGRAWYLPLGHRRTGELDLGDGLDNLPALDSDALRPLVELLEDASVPKVGHDLKRSLLRLASAGVALRGLDFDTMIASYLIDTGRAQHRLDSLALQYLDYRALTIEDVRGKGKDQVALAECAVEAVRDLACEGADLALRLSGLFQPELERHALDRLFADVEMPLVSVLADMERAGIRIDGPFFDRMSEKLQRELALIEEDIYKQAGMEFNINSTPQLREVLFEKLELPVVKRTKTGASTDASVLEQLAADGHSLPRLILEYRQLDKLKGTYVDALPRYVDPGTGRIHTSFDQAVAATGRLSSSDPNLQNIPIRTEVGAEIRKGFVPERGHVFLSADYSQIELRVLAHLSGDPTFVDAFRRGVDIHKQTAAIVFDVPVEQVDGQQRAAAKTINFATIYGVGPYMLSQRLGTAVGEAKEFIEQYFQRLPDVRRYLDDQIAMAKEKGYVETISGRRRYIPEVFSKNWNIRQFGERAATNAPVQGSAADIIKIAMLRVHDALAGSGARMLLQVHDELVFEVPGAALDSVRERVRTTMESAFPLDVPLEVGIGVGENWLECK